MGSRVVVAITLDGAAGEAIITVDQSEQRIVTPAHRLGCQASYWRQSRCMTMRGHGVFDVHGVESGDRLPDRLHFRKM